MIKLFMWLLTIKLSLTIKLLISVLMIKLLIFNFVWLLTIKELLTIYWLSYWYGYYGYCRLSYWYGYVFIDVND